MVEQVNPYCAKISKYQPTPEDMDIIRRRTEPFMDSFSLGHRPIGVLIGEAYVQGLRDAAEAMGVRND